METCWRLLFAGVRVLMLEHSGGWRLSAPPVQAQLPSTLAASLVSC
jgi:nitrogen fixation protein